MTHLTNNIHDIQNTSIFTRSHKLTIKNTYSLFHIHKDMSTNGRSSTRSSKKRPLPKVRKFVAAPKKRKQIQRKLPQWLLQVPHITNVQEGTSLGVDMTSDGTPNVDLVPPRRASSVITPPRQKLPRRASSVITPPRQKLLNDLQQVQGHLEYVQSQKVDPDPGSEVEPEPEEPEVPKTSEE